MTRLLPAQIIAATNHFRHNITVADSCLLRVKGQLLRRFIEAEVAHYGRYNRAIFKLACPVHSIPANAKDIVSIDLFTLLINRNQAIGIAIECKSQVCSQTNNLFLQLLRMR
ncbi:hypothetical protein D3C73_953690 [compost metagenome]